MELKRLGVREIVSVLNRSRVSRVIFLLTRLTGVQWTETYEVPVLRRSFMNWGLILSLL